MKHLNLLYYGMAVLTVLMYTLFYYLVTHQLLACLNPQSPLGQAVQYVVILNAIISIPVGLYWFKRQCGKIRQIENEQERIRLYVQWDKVRIVVVSQTMVLAVIAYCWMGFYQSMIWVAAIGAIGWYFTKPTEAKMHAELAPAEEQY